MPWGRVLGVVEGVLGGVVWGAVGAGAGSRGGGGWWGSVRAVGGEGGGAGSRGGPSNQVHSHPCTGNGPGLHTQLPIIYVRAGSHGGPYEVVHSPPPCCCSAAKGGKETENMCRDCRTPVHNNDKAIACDLCEHWMHAQCQDMPDTTYAFLSDNEDSGINWYCNHCKVIATGVVSEVSKMAKNYQDKEKRVKKLETQIKSKANEADLEELRRELLSDIEDKVTQDTLTNLEQNIREDTEKFKKVKKAMEELSDDIPRSEEIKRMIQEELKWFQLLLHNLEQPTLWNNRQ